MKRQDAIALNCNQKGYGKHFTDCQIEKIKNLNLKFIRNCSKLGRRN